MSDMKFGKREWAYLGSMVSIIAILMLIMIVSSTWCSKPEKGEPSREELAIDWIFLAPKPITCYPYGHTIQGTTYTLINSEAGVYMTGPIKIALPDTIK
jgi:hypothetical protein